MRDLAILQGTPKQIAWGEKIRAHILAEMDSRLESLAAAVLPPPDIDAYREGRELLAQETSARFWIEHREKGAINLASLRYKLEHGQAEIRRIEGEDTIVEKRLAR